MESESPRTKARQLAAESLDRGDPVGWFDALYAGAAGDERAIYWADLVPNANLVEWLDRAKNGGGGRRALVVGCGLGDDAEELARRGYAVVAFDVSPTAVAWCQERFPASPVAYAVADALAPPPAWRGAFDLVVEVYTLQVLPPEVRARAVGPIAGCVAPGGTLLVVARGRDAADEPGAMPWPLTREDLAGFLRHGLREVAFEDYLDGEEPPVRRFRVEYRAGARPPGAR